MAAWRTLLTLLAAAAAIAPTPAQAKRELVGVLVCGADRCAQLHGQALDEAAGILSHRMFRRSGGALPFSQRFSSSPSPRQWRDGAQPSAEHPLVDALAGWCSPLSHVAMPAFSA